ncbi:hypothetical protein ARMGADRAFT_1033438 [Armillaria gallica]|uniref:Uncharacterized protein n=1 Tax=Armillaria gallica TaxID=47427 RepID=A0A2H3D2B2_ARMGA|nr:hypothetical protein ARMGADRAFT_1033438 [Armillaria gallica]
MTPGLNDADIAKVLSDLGSEMDRMIPASLLQGLYTGIIAVGLWNICEENPASHTSGPWLCWLVLGQCWQIQVLLPALCLIAAAGLILASTLWRALLMIYRVLTVVQGAPAQGEGAYWHFLEVFVSFGIAPTLLVEHVAVGHACPDDSWKGSMMTSPLCFGQDKTEKTSLVYKLT